MAQKSAAGKVGQKPKAQTSPRKGLNGAASRTHDSWTVSSGEIELELAFPAEGKGEAPKTAEEGTEPSTVKSATERPATDRLMEEVCERENVNKALRRVRSNQGAPGIDGMTVDQLRDHLLEHWPTIREQLIAGRYKPRAVRRVTIPKPDGGERKLGIPTALDRLIQQAILQVLQPIWDSAFSDRSYGFRPGRSAHQAITKAQEYVGQGKAVVVDMDLEKFFLVLPGQEKVRIISDAYTLFEPFYGHFS